MNNSIEAVAAEVVRDVVIQDLLLQTSKACVGCNPARNQIHNSSLLSKFICLNCSLLLRSQASAIRGLKLLPQLQCL